MADHFFEVADRNSRSQGDSIYADQSSPFALSARDLAFSNRGDCSPFQHESRQRMQGDGRTRGNQLDISGFENISRRYLQDMVSQRSGFDYYRNSNHQRWQDQTRGRGSRPYYSDRCQPHFHNNQSLDAGNMLKSLIVRGLVDAIDRNSDHRYPGQRPGYSPRYQPDYDYRPDIRPRRFEPAYPGGSHYIQPRRDQAFYPQPEFSRFDHRLGRPQFSPGRGQDIGRQIVNRVVVPMVLNEIFNRGSSHRNLRHRRW